MKCRYGVKDWPESENAWTPWAASHSLINAPRAREQNINSGRISSQIGYIELTLIFVPVRLNAIALPPTRINIAQLHSEDNGIYSIPIPV